MNDFDVASSNVMEWMSELQRAYGDAETRRAFEAECSRPPLAETSGQPTQAEINDSETYFLDFRVWATRRLGLEAKAPTEIRRKLAA